MNYRFDGDGEYIKNLLTENAELRKESAKKGVIILNQHFYDSSFENIVLRLLQMQDDKTVDEITLYINSSGGHGTTCLGLIDLIDRVHKVKPVTFVGIGRCYSAGAFLLAAGAKGYRKAYKNTCILFHETRLWLDGEKAKQAELEVEFIKKFNNRMADLLRKRTKMPEKEIKRFIFSSVDEFIWAEDALRWGVIDEII